MSSYEEILDSTGKSPTFNFEVDGHTVAWILNHKINAKKHTKSICYPYKCRECSSRAKTMVCHEGINGPMLFHGNNVSSEDVLTKLRDLALKICSCKDNIEPQLITPATYPPSEYTNENGQKKDTIFKHFTIIPDKVTSLDAILRLTPLWNLLTYGIDERLGKFLTTDARLSMPIILSCIKDLENKEIYEHSAEWIINIQNRFPKNFSSMSFNEIMELRIFAMMTGRANGSVHFGFSSSQNFISLLTMDSRNAVVNTLSDRSSDHNYQRTELIRKLDDYSVTSKYTVSLIWDGKIYKDDLDLRIVLPCGSICDYNNKNIKKHILDFDAGISGNEASPVENISCSGEVPVTIQINNYGRRTTDKDIHANIFIREVGQNDIIIPVIWSIYRKSHDFMTIITHVFKNNEYSIPQMSEKLASAAIVQNDSFTKLFGDYKTEIATLYNVDGEVIILNKQFKQINRNKDLNFMSTAVKIKGQKTPLHVSCLKDPSTVSDLIKLLKEETHDLYIHLPDHPPGYIVNVSVSNRDAMKSGKNTTSINCHYQDKFKLPVLPNKLGNARLDNSWINDRSKLDDFRVKVTGIIFKNNKYFFSLENAILPQTRDFPIGGGFYPTDLSHIAHVHRTRWTHNHSTMRPHVPLDSPLVIGTFLVDKRVTVFLDNRKLILNVC